MIIKQLNQPSILNLNHNAFDSMKIKYIFTSVQDKY